MVVVDSERKLFMNVNHLLFTSIVLILTGVIWIIVAIKRKRDALSGLVLGVVGVFLLVTCIFWIIVVHPTPSPW